MNIWYNLLEKRRKEIAIMNKTTKNILYGVGTFVLCLVILVVIRSLIKGVAIGEQIKNWTNWALAALSGISAGYSAYSKDKAKEEKEKKENQ